MAMLKRKLDTVRNELDRCIEFWMKHSIDSNNGGFLNCLTREGKLYDQYKYGWLQGRQVYTLAYLYNEFPRFHKPEILKAARDGASFLIHCIKDQQTGRCAFSVGAAGEKVQYQRTIFTECFYSLGMAELYIATKEDFYLAEAHSCYKRIIEWSGDPTGLGKYYSGRKVTNNLAVPMMLLVLSAELRRASSTTENVSVTEWALNSCLKHIQRRDRPGGPIILENIKADGSDEPDTAVGRLVNPGHAIETGWIMLEEAIHRDDKQLAGTAIKNFITAMFEFGWDNEHGGIYYYLDADGYCPVQLEWSMKLWWTHCEALVGLLMAYKYDKNPDHLTRFNKIWDYTMSHFPDKEHGEWFGYLSSEGNLTHTWKGGPYKGCFHLPRSLALLEKLLVKLVAEEDTQTNDP